MALPAGISGGLLWGSWGGAFPVEAGAREPLVTVGHRAMRMVWKTRERARGRFGKGEKRQLLTGDRITVYKYMPGSEEEVGGLSSSVNEINGSEA